MTSLAITRAYQQSFESHPHTTLAVTGGFFNALGDFVAQISQIVVSYPSMYSETAQLMYHIERITKSTKTTTCYALCVSSVLVLRSVSLVPACSLDRD